MSSQDYKRNKELRYNLFKTKIIQSLKKVDILFFIFFISTTMLLLYASVCPSNLYNLLFVRAAILIVVLGLVYLHAFQKHILLHLFRNTYPIIFSGYFYSETVYYNKSFLNDIDPMLEMIEFSLFGMQPSIVFSARFASPFFGELMYLGYFSFYILIFGFTLNILLKKKYFVNRGIFLLTASLYIFYLFFGLVPSAGPQFYFCSPDNIPPKALFFDKIMHIIQRTAEQPTGAFPSSHVGISLIILMLSRKKMPVFYMVALPFTVILIVSTVYIKAHYLVDVIAAMIIAPLVLCLSQNLFRLLSKKT